MTRGKIRDDVSKKLTHGSRPPAAGRCMFRSTFLRGDGDPERLLRVCEIELTSGPCCCHWRPFQERAEREEEEEEEEQDDDGEETSTAISVPWPVTSFPLVAGAGPPHIQEFEFGFGPIHYDMIRYKQRPYRRCPPV